MKRIVTNEEVLKYENLIEHFIKKSVVKNWKEASTAKSKGDVSLGNSGYTMDDLRQDLRTEVVVALQNYNPNKGTKESSFIYTHLFNRLGQKMKRLTRRSFGYGIWTVNLEQFTHEIDGNE